MKKFIIYCLFCLLGLIDIKAQYVSSEVVMENFITSDTVQKTKIVYAELLGVNTNLLGLGTNVTVQVDFGEKNGLFNDGKNSLVDEDGKVIKFNSMVDGMNYMGAHGWKFETAYVVTINKQNVIHWLMSKEIPLDADAKEGFKQIRDVKEEKKKEKESKKNDDTKKSKKASIKSDNNNFDDIY